MMQFPSPVSLYQPPQPVLNYYSSPQLPPPPVQNISYPIQWAEGNIDEYFNYLKNPNLNNPEVFQSYIPRDISIKLKHKVTELIKTYSEVIKTKENEIKIHKEEIEQLKYQHQMHSTVLGTSHMSNTIDKTQLEDRIRELEAQIRQKDKHIQIVIRDKTDLTTKIEQLSRAHAALETQLQQETANLQEEQRQHAAANAKIAELERFKQNHEHSLAADMQQENREIVRLNVELQQKNQELKIANDWGTEVQGRYDQAFASANDYSKKILNLERELDRCKHTHALATRGGHDPSDVTQYQQKITTLEQELNIEKAKEKDLQKKIDEFLNHPETLSNLQKNVETVWNQQKQVSGALKPTFWGKSLKPEHKAQAIKTLMLGTYQAHMANLSKK